MTTMFDSTYTLEDRYARDRGRVFLNGDQALVRVLLMQRQRDQMAGLRTGGFVSGYRGSPLGVLDMALWAAGDRLKSADIHFQPGVNEELAATAVWGTQQLEMIGESEYDGVFGMWYGKGPGVDRAGDALKTANYHGTANHGGVLALCGDDHAARSSSLAHQSEYALMSFGMPILNPSSVQDYIDYGLYGYALSRFSGCWVGFICVTDTVETAASVLVDEDRLTISTPDREPWRPNRTAAHGPLIEADRSLYNVRLPAAQEFVRHNGLDRTVLGDARSRMGIITCGKAYNDVRQAMQTLGIDEARAQALGIGLFKVAMTWPLEPTAIAEFCQGKANVLVVEEKRPLIEDQLKTILFEAGGDRPQLFGKRDWAGQPLVSNYGELSATDITGAIVRWVEHSTGQTLDRPREPLRDLPQFKPGTDLARKPAFCSGCPHNISTKVPEGSMALGGIGCHGMVAMMPERHTMGATPMGSEGANWIGQSRFTSRQHIFQNLGDGTYYHSGILAIRAALSADVNITYKILANDAVAMTGGQPVEGNVTAPVIAQQVAAEGVTHIAVVTDEPDKYPRGVGFPPGVKIHHRSEMDEIQRAYRETSGVTVIIYDQACAAEKRRLRKRKKLVDPAKRVIINELVCEGCGDCNVQSNCISIEPVETEFGRKRRIDQSSCNKDYSCLEGYCPSLVTVYGGELRSSSDGTRQSLSPRRSARMPPSSPAASAPSWSPGSAVRGSSRWDRCWPWPPTWRTSRSRSSTCWEWPRRTVR
jgi:indolepyruvate ferredoxin oxidoreductase